MGRPRVCPAARDAPAFRNSPFFASPHPLASSHSLFPQPCVVREHGLCWTRTPLPDVNLDTPVPKIQRIRASLSSPRIHKTVPRFPLLSVRLPPVLVLSPLCISPTSQVVWPTWSSYASTASCGLARICLRDPLCTDCRGLEDWQGICRRHGRAHRERGGLPTESFVRDSDTRLPLTWLE